MATVPVPDAALGARGVFTRGQRAALLGAVALLAALRLPFAWVEGRFLDEEATVFLAYAWHHPWADALFRSFGGYLNLAANATTLAVARLVGGSLVPLELAPYLTMTAGLTAQLVPAILILTGRARWLSGRAAVLAALLLPVLAPATEELFLNVMHIQFHLALAAALILALDPPTGRVARIGYRAVLVAAPLCGPAAIVLLPLFALRAILDRDPARVRQCAVLGLGAAVQLIFFAHVSPVRALHPDPVTLAAALSVRLIALSALGYPIAYGLGALVFEAKGTVVWWAAAATGAVLLGSLLAAAARRRDAALWLALSGLAIAGATFGFGMASTSPSSLFSVQAGERYGFLPQVLVGFALIALAMRRTRHWRVPAALCALMLLTGLFDYPRSRADFAHGPSWRAEVAAWRHDRRHPLAVWPRPWRADLSDLARACSPAGAGPRPSEPRYCENGWAAPFFRPPS